MNNLECAEIVGGSNLKLLAEHKTRIHKMECVYQTPCPRASLLKGWIFLRRKTFAKVTGTLHYRPDVGTIQKCGVERRPQLVFYFFFSFLLRLSTAFMFVAHYSRSYSY
jgi:hypothetical protein